VSNLCYSINLTLILCVANMNQRGEIIKDILIGLGTLGAIVIVGTIAPNIFGVLNKSGFTKKKYNPGRFTERIKYLRRRNLIAVKDNPDGTLTVELSERGRKFFLKYNLDDISVKPMKRWDGKWRFVMFDIPDKFKKASNALRNKLKDMGFYQFQKSIWVHPYPVRDEIEFVCNVFNVREYVNVGEISKLDDEEMLRSRWRLS